MDEIDLFRRRLAKLSPIGRGRIQVEYDLVDATVRGKALEAVRFECAVSGWTLPPAPIWQPARCALHALFVHRVLDDMHFRTLYGPWASVFGWEK